MSQKGRYPSALFSPMQVLPLPSPAPPPPHRPCMWPCRQEPSPSDSCPPPHLPASLVEDKSLQAWVLPPGPPCIPAFQSGGCVDIKASSEGTWGSSHTIKGSRQEKSTGAWVHMKGQHAVSCSQTAEHLPSPVGVSMGWGGGLGGSAVHSGFRFLHF